MILLPKRNSGEVNKKKPDISCRAWTILPPISEKETLAGVLLLCYFNSIIFFVIIVLALEIR